jgi:hypothetical protein
MKSLVAAAVVVVVAALMGCPEPIYDDRIGVQGVAVPEGSLAGSFAVQSQALDLANTAVGEADAGGITYVALDRTWDADTRVYTQTMQVCHVLNFEVFGLTILIDDAVSRTTPPFSTTLTVDHPTGAYATEEIHEVWAINFDELGDPIPADADDNRIFDQDDDGLPGATIQARGLVEGDIYFAQRKTLTFDGVVTGEDTAVGLVSHKKESLVLEATNDLLKTEGERRQHPDPKGSWFREVRIAEGAGCDAVDALIADGTLNELQPF